MERPSHIAEVHVERGSQMRAVLEHDVAVRGLSVDEVMASLAAFLGVDRASVEFGVAIANEWNPR